MNRVLVTGGGSGIGLAIAAAFLRDGAAVLVGDLDPSALASAAAAAPGLHGAVADMGDPASAEAVASAVVESVAVRAAVAVVACAALALAALLRDRR